VRAKTIIRKFLFTNLLITFTATILLTAIGSYYISHNSIQRHLDEVLIELGFIFRNSTPVENLTPAALRKMQEQIKEEIHFTQALPRQIQNRLRNDIKQRHHYQFQLWDRKQGRLLAHSALVSDTPLIGSPGLMDKTVANKRWRIFTIPDEKQNFIFIVAESYEFRRRLIHSIIMEDLYLALLVYTPSALFIWLIVSRGLKKCKA
jgi:Two-component sensor kinase N-terminal